MEEGILDNTYGYNVYCKFDLYIPVNELINLQHPRNRNKHSDAGVNRLAKAMDTPAIGVRHPIVISTFSNKIVVGHKRLKCAIQNKWSHFPVEFQTFVDESSEYAHTQGDNGHGQDSELDLAGIHADLEHLDSFDLDLLGMDFKLEPDPKIEKNQRLCPHCSGPL